MTFETLKGTRDYAFLEATVKERMFSTLKEEFMKNGFRPFQTPHIEYRDTLTHKYDETAEIVQEIFNVQDRGQRELGLRYDLTIPLCRFLAQNIKSLKLPFRRYHIGSAFRDGPVKMGRLREFEQCDCDVVGLKGQEIEIELMELYYRCYRKLGLDIVIELNSNKILKGALLQNGFKEDELDTAVLIIDKFKKIGEENVIKELVEKGIDEEISRRALTLLTQHSLEELEKKAEHEILKQGRQELQELVRGCKILGIPTRVNVTMSRGHSYYTGNIWEVYDTTNTVTSSIGAGGRYDKGIANYIGVDEEIPAVGISFGVVGMMELLLDKEKKNSKNESGGVTNILVVPLKSELVLDAMQIAQRVREEDNLNTEVFYGFKLKKAFDYADYLGVEELIIYGEKDKEQQQYTRRNLVSGKEKIIK
ncbi:MAG: histidine--tRNA ligase, partial [Candidatus Woesearchaeota archaeon]